MIDINIKQLQGNHRNANIDITMHKKIYFANVYYGKPSLTLTLSFI